MSALDLTQVLIHASRLACYNPQMYWLSVPHPSNSAKPVLALAETGQGVAIVPSLQRTDRYKVRVARITHSGKPIRERVAIHWDRRRPLPPYAVTFCEHLARYMQTVLPITKPTKAPNVFGSMDKTAASEWTPIIGC